VGRGSAASPVCAASAGAVSTVAAAARWRCGCCGCGCGDAGCASSVAVLDARRRVWQSGEGSSVACGGDAMDRVRSVRVGERSARASAVAHP
jgi:hypothetical protein